MRKVKIRQPDTFRTFVTVGSFEHLFFIFLETFFHRSFLLRGEDEVGVEKGFSGWTYLLCVNVVVTLIVGWEFICPVTLELAPSL